MSTHTAIIISNDSDYEPAARLVKETYSKEVEVVYLRAFAGSRPFAMEKVATMRVFRQSLLKEHDYDPKEMGELGSRAKREESGDNKREAVTPPSVAHRYFILYEAAIHIFITCIRY